ncbi:MAG: 16S rRNA (uracil(1498)-N(3))-methyltransferase [Gemmatimonadota bacterium]|nr:16S rRNA (uracil(1498)-N(3))-methyltransferase [Gemmatimonadota bacterium]
MNLTERAAFLVDHAFSVGSQVPLSEADAQHVAVLRLGVGERVGLRDGAGRTASGSLVRMGRKNALVDVEEVGAVAPPAPIHLLVPVADRDRMLWLAEKAAELNVASWRPVLWQRSRSVSPRGDGPTFRSKVRTRMISALLQSRSAWLPELFPEANPERALAACPAGSRIVMEGSGSRPRAAVRSDTVVVAVGPEGGFEPEELAQLVVAGFSPVAIGQSVLRFETAAIAGIVLARAMLDPAQQPEP